MNAWSNDKQRFRPPDIRPMVPIESGRASLSQPLHNRTRANAFSLRMYLNFILLQLHWLAISTYIAYQLT